MSAALSDDLLARLSNFATESFGLRFPPDRWSELARGIASAALELGIADLEGWAESLVGGMRLPEQLVAIANHLTISETYFFRQRESFDLLESEALPARLAERRQHVRGLRIWSAGCASGEEPYSVAILIRNRFPEVVPETVRILGTDINSRGPRARRTCLLHRVVFSRRTGVAQGGILQGDAARPVRTHSGNQTYGSLRSAEFGRAFLSRRVR